MPATTGGLRSSKRSWQSGPSVVSTEWDEGVPPETHAEPARLECDIELEAMLGT